MAPMGFVRLHPDARFTSPEGPQGASHTLSRESNGASLTLNRPQYLVARLLAHARSVEQLVVAARGMGVGISETQVQRFLDGLRQKELVEDQPEPPVNGHGGAELLTRPKLRGDLSIRRISNGGSVLHEVSVPGGLTPSVLYDLELSIARLMNGERSLEQIVASGSQGGVPMNLEQLTKFVRQLGAQNLLENIHPRTISGSYQLGVNSEPAFAPAPSPPGAPPMPGQAPGRDHPRKLVQAGLALMRRGAFIEAVDVFQAALAADPSHPEAAALLEIARSNLGPRALPAGDTSSEPAALAVLEEAASAAAPVEEEPAEVEPAEAEDPAESEEAVARRARRSRLRWAIRLVVLGAAVAASVVVQYPLRITEACTLVANRRMAVRVLSDGMVTEVLTAEGQVVKEGEVLGRLSSGSRSAELIHWTSEVNKVEAELALLRQGARPEELARLRAQVASSMRELRLANTKVARVRQLAQNQLASSDEIDAANRERLEKLGTLEQSKASLKLMQAGARPQELEKKEAELRAATAQRELASRQLAELELRAPFAGIVTTPRPQDKLMTVVKRGDEFVEVVEASRMRVEARVSEGDLSVLKLGAKVTVKVSSLPSSAFAGKVTWVSQAVESTPQGSFLRVESEIENPAGEVRPGMTGFVEIDGGRRSVLSLVLRRAVAWVRVRFII
ncbi:MAG: HlyD family efflux transporter periplasmic adaptor subunit [Archangiaceae bacterium]|nr:HlyD family efflux transporter periplasmic adaptor subunit [Archangiaceae bacterium]